MVDSGLQDPASPIRIKVIGDGQADAQRLAAAMPGIAPIEAPGAGAQPEGSFGAAEIVLTLVATAASKALIMVAIEHLRDFLEEKLRAEKKRLKVQVVVRRNGQRDQHTVIDLGKATLELSVAFCKALEKGIEDL